MAQFNQALDVIVAVLRLLALYYCCRAMKELFWW